MKSLMQLLRQTLYDIDVWCSTDTTLDFLQIERRVEHEGLQFLTITLPTFCSGFEKSLELGYVDPSHFHGFERNRRRGPLPRLFEGLVGRVFDSSSGLLLDEPCVDSIRAIRQVCSMWKKLRVPCSEERERKAYARFIKTNEDCIHFNIESSRGGFYLPREFSGTEACLRPRDDIGRFTTLESFSSNFPTRTPARTQWSSSRTVRYRDLRSRCVRFTAASRILWGNKFTAVSERIQSYDLLPRHGPGATADRISGNAKYEIKRWHSRLETLFPLCEYAIPNYGHADSLRDIRVVPPGAEKPVKVITVPKTHKTPRIIAIEPVCMQYTQQALMSAIVSTLECDALTGGHINFSDQSVNQRLALESSKTQEYSTLDLSDASDRVPSAAVWMMFSANPLLRDAVFATRSLTAAVPGHGVIPLGRFASMGSALCFPIEAMVFYTLILSGMAYHDGVQLSPRNLSEYGAQVYVYGDDIIIPTRYVQTVISELEGFNLQVNANKSFEKGKFRESCGLDAYDGHRVTPVYLRSMQPTSRQCVEELETWVSFGNQLYEIGYWRASRFVRGLVDSLYKLPIVQRTSSLLGWHSYTHVQEYHRYNRALFTWETRSLKRWSPKRVSVITDTPALMKCLLSTGRSLIIGNIYEPAFIDKNHLRFAGRPQRAYTKIGWAT